MNDSEYICPVPKDQRPLNEYKKLKESNNFLWCIQDKSTYLKSFWSIRFSRCFFLFSFSFCFCS